jgi:hypothetical protein
MSQVVEHLPRKVEALSSNLIITKTRKRKGKKKEIIVYLNSPEVYSF